MRLAADEFVRSLVKTSRPINVVEWPDTLINASGRWEMGQATCKDFSSNKCR